MGTPVLMPALRGGERSQAAQPHLEPDAPLALSIKLQEPEFWTTNLGDQYQEHRPIFFFLTFLNKCPQIKCSAIEKNSSLMIVSQFQKCNKMTLSVTSSASQQCPSHLVLLH